jgi:predicted N-formylglutamate amidohydrolase
VSPLPPTLLDERDPLPAQVVRKDGRSDLVLVGDHAGNAIPSSLGDLGLSQADLRRHIAWDIGVRALGEELGALLDATFVFQAFSRLVIDCNRDPRSASSIVEGSDGTPIPGNMRLGPAAREERRARIHEPYHRTIASELERRMSRGRPVLVALHSFTPVLGSERRPWHVGLLHDRGDTSLSAAMLSLLRREPGLTVGDNEPYKMDGTDYTVPAHAYASELPYLEVEIRQDLLSEHEGPRLWAARLARLLLEAIPAALARGTSA